MSRTLLDKRKKLVVVYDSPYDEGKVDFIDELHSVLDSW
jgi:hypothetical protein